jgi:hypothetical protein
MGKEPVFSMSPIIDLHQGKKCGPGEMGPLGKRGNDT